MTVKRPKIFVVDDSITNLRVAKNALLDYYEVYAALSATKMFELLETQKPELILLDLEMPEIDGYEALRRLKQKSETQTIPVIFLTGISESENELKGLSLGAVDYIVKPFSPPLLRMRIDVHLTLQSQRVELERQREQLQHFNENLQLMVAEKTERVVQLQSAVLTTVANLVENRDGVTGAHVERASRGMEILIHALQDQGVYRAEVDIWNIPLVLQSSQLHDVGKITISDAILGKPGRLTEAEYQEMKTHTLKGVEIVEKIALISNDVDFMKYAKIMAGDHHEHWNGQGYPRGLKGEEIPLLARLMALVDVYDALVSERPYKRPFSHECAMQIILEGKGSQFDPSLVDIFLSVADQFETLKFMQRINH